MSKGYKPFAKKKCEDCDVIMRRAYVHKGKLLCYRCYKTYFTRIPSCSWVGRPQKTMQEVLNKIYLPNVYTHDRTFYCAIHLPQIVVGHKFKLVLVDEEDKT